MFRAFVITPATGANLFPVPTLTGGTTYDFDSVDKAKSQTQVYIAANKASFSNGYDAYVLDTTAHQIVSFATIPQPTLNWQDSTAAGRT